MHLRQYEIVTDKDKLNIDIRYICEKYSTIKQWAYILHDKDDTRPHYHIYLNFGVGVDSKIVAQWFQIGENFISKVKGRKVDILLYLTHENESQKYKHIYDRSEIVSNFNVSLEIEQSKMIGDFVHYSYAQQLTFVNSLPLSEKVVAYNKLKKLWEIECQSKVLNTSRNLQVVFICGKGGCGKTYYAKKMLDSMGLDYCISSSSNDPFQDYLGQKAIILDDLRDNTFSDSRGDGFEDFLKIIDNHTSSSVKSRFSNKVFNGEVIVITTTVPLSYWFSSRRSEYNGYDNLYQLYRRIGTYIVITSNEVKLYSKGVDSKGFPKGEPVVYENELKSIVFEQDNKINFNNVFDKICLKSNTLPLLAEIDINDNLLPF